jgi:hypothetical protein
MSHRDSGRDNLPWASGYLTTAMTRPSSALGEGSSAQESTRLSPTTSSASILNVLNTYSPSLSESYLAPSTSSSHSTERISQGAVSSDSQCRGTHLYPVYAYQLMSKPGSRATAHLLHRSTSLTMTHFSTSSISIGYFL